MSTTDKDRVVPGGKSPEQEADEQQQVEKEQEDQEADVKTPATAVLEAAQPFEVEGGEGKVHQMQARHAKLAMGEALRDAKRHVANAADVRPVLRKHPYLTVGGSLAIGFVAAAALVPSKKQRAAARLRALERAVRAEAAVGDRASAVKPAPSKAKKVIGLAWRFARPTLLSMATGAISGAAGGAANADDGPADADPAADVT